MPLMPHSRTTRAAGFTLLEVLIAVVIFAIGLLGTAAMLALSIRVNHGAEIRTEAVFLAQSLADRMRANSAALWDPTAPYNSTVYPIAGTPPTCTMTAPCGYLQVAQRDKLTWSQQLISALPPGSTAQVNCARPAGATTFSPSVIAAVPPYDGLCTITLNWPELSLAYGASASTQTFAWVFQP